MMTCLAMASSSSTTTTVVQQRCVVDLKSNLQRKQQQQQSVAVVVPISLLPISRRCVVLLSVMMMPLSITPLASEARERRNRKIVSPEDYLTSSDGLKYYDLVEGKGPTAGKGATVEVHFDCIYRGITALSSRESKLLAGNRSIAQIGAPPGKERKREFVDSPNGLFSAQASPKPPPAMYSITEGMKVGGKRTVIVPPEVGYGKKGMNEIPPGATFELNVEVLQVLPPETK
ncbi:hypothetical protein GIB67_030038 [Kingdonia uniflora]|uniref:peptidylprolyl isomerase n=1 Tax=Kingdonia uniflora TaxID=39325 RepID=A0A7J7MYC3_9MAGN|nr:hypothetical protein GIB67_030038 [Kingdonia uniflora]